MKTFTVGCAVLLSMLGVQRAYGVLYSVTYLGGLGGQSATPYAINNLGQVVGVAELANGSDSHAFLYSNGTMTDLGTLGGRDSNARDINDSGQVVGWATNSNNRLRAFLWDSGSMSDLGTLGGEDSFARGINNNGQIVGNAMTPGNVSCPLFIYSNGTMTNLGLLGQKAISGQRINSSAQVVGSIWLDLNYERGFVYPDTKTQSLTVFGGPYSHANGINDSGQVVGSVLELNHSHAYLYSNGTTTYLAGFGGNYSEAYGINNRGEVVGQAINAAGNGRAFLYSSGLLRDLSTLLDASGEGLTVSEAYDISDTGQIVAVGLVGGQSKAVLLTPFDNPTWNGGIGAIATEWGRVENWKGSIGVPDGSGIKVSFGNQLAVNSTVDMATVGRTVGSLDFAAATGTTIKSTGGKNLTLDNGISAATISVAGNHTISAPVVLNSDLDVSGTGNLDLSGGISGNHALNVLSGSVTAKRIEVDTLTIGAGASVTILETTGGAANAAPEPSTFVLLVMGAIGLLGVASRWRASR